MGGHLKVSKWLWKMSNESINLHKENDRIFRTCCKSGYLDIVKWLWEISNGKIDLHVDNDYGFIVSCLNAHADVSRWLCDLYLDERYLMKIDAVYEYDDLEEEISTDLYIDLCERNSRIINSFDNPYEKNDLYARVIWMIGEYGLREVCRLF